MPYILSCLVAFAVTVCCIWLLRPLAIRLGLVDLPVGRKQHQGHTPLIGGIGMFLGFLFALLTLPISLVEYRSFIAGSALLVFIGVLDDFHELTPRARLIAQLIAALLMTAAAKVILYDLGNIFFYKSLLLGNWGLPFTIIAVIGVINAVNMTDGIDGLAGGLVFIEIGFLAFLAFQNGHMDIVLILSLILATLLGFLFFNFPIFSHQRAAVFMGDAGSMFLGFALVWFLVKLSQVPTQVVRPATMLWIAAIPLFDFVSVVLRRLQTRTSLISADREHFHYMLLEVGFSRIQVVLTLCLASFILGTVGILGERVGISDGIMFLGFLGVFLLYLLVFRYLRLWVKKK